jgi:spore coat protein U-like protein
MTSFLRSKARQATALAWATMSVCSSAGVVTAPFLITARYQQTCQITASTATFDFGNVTSNSATLYTTATLMVGCDINSQTPFGVWAPLSANANGTQRRMRNNNTSAGNYLNYNLLIGDADLEHGDHHRLHEPSGRQFHRRPAARPVAIRADPDAGLLQRRPDPHGELLT